MNEASKVLITGASGLVGSRVVELLSSTYPGGFNLSLKNDKIKRLGINMNTFENGLKELKNQ